MSIRGMNRLAGFVRSRKEYKDEYKSLARLGLPVMITQIGIVVVSFADTIMVGRCGTRELAASAFVNAIFLVAVVMLFGFSGGLTPLAGNLFGKGDREGVGRLAKAGFYTNVGVAAVFTLILGVLYFFVDKLGQPVELMPLVRPYYLVMLCTLIPMAIFNSFQQISNGCTDTATPMWLVVISNGLNILGNWLLIWGNWGFPKLGLLGAGISTLAARVLAMIAIVLIYLLSRSRRGYMQGWRRCGRAVTKRLCGNVWRTSYPVMFQSGIECFMWSFGGIVSGWFGTIQLASYQVVNTIAQLGYMIYMGFGVATSIRVANFCGTGEFPAARRIASAGLHMVLLLAVISSTFFILFFHQMVGVFTPDAAVETAAVPLLLPLVLYQFGDAVQLTYANALRGTSCVKPLLWAALTSYIVAGIPFMLLLAVTFDLKNVGVYYSFTLALMLAAFILWRSFRRVISRLQKGQIKEIL